MDWTREELERHPVGHYKVVTIATGIQVEGGHRVLDRSELAGLLKGARRISGDRLGFDPDRCAGRGLCVRACPAGGIERVDREIKRNDGRA